jgi:hypothetical protein
MPVVALLAAVAVASPNVTQLVLKPAQVGRQYTLVTRSDGFGTSQATLDLCGRTGYASEALRVARLQVDYRRTGSPLSLSNEVVRYKGGGAKEAMREVTRRASSCPSRPIDSGAPGLPKLRFTITVLHDVKLLKDALAVRVRVRGIVQGKSVDQTSYAVYQRFGDFLSGVYSSGPNTHDQLEFCLHAAEQSARVLREQITSGGVTA